MAIALLAPVVIGIVLLADIVPFASILFCRKGLALAPRRIIDLRLVNFTKFAKIPLIILLLRLLHLVVPLIPIVVRRLLLVPILLAI